MTGVQRAPTSPTAPVVVQRITTWWTKRTRGAAGRENRARLPVAYALPDSVLVSRAASACHSVERGESSGYLRERQTVSFDAQPTARLGGATGAVRLARRPDGLAVAFDGNAFDTGRPSRAAVKPTLLLPGQVATIRFNGRFVGHEDPWYEDKLVHVAFGVALTRDLFVEARPAFVIDARADLW
jgi:hypothetical protein